MVDELGGLDATEQARLVASREVSAAEMVRAGLDRISRDNAPLNAVVVDLADKAAATVPHPGRLHGVPLLVKDVCATAGDASYHGMRALKEAGWRDRHDQSLIGRLRRAGAVICGKTNLCELGTSLTTEPVAFGATHNPWDPGVSAGGSSGGSAAAVAAGMVAAAHGTDGGGSVRVPAARCGIVGLKPSRGRVSSAPYGEHMGGLLVEGVLSRTVRDAAVLLDVLQGPEPGDPYAAPPPRRPYVDDVTAEPGRLRIGVYTEVPGCRRALHGDCRAAVQHAAELLASMGHHVEQRAPSVLDADVLGAEGPKIYWVAYAAMLARWERALARTLGGGDVEPLTWAFVERGRAVSAPEYVAAQAAMQRVGREVAQWYATGFDLLLLATTAEPPPPLGAWVSTPEDPLRAARAGMATSQLNSLANHTGQPAVSLPVGSTVTGLPVGVQLVAPYGREDLLVAVAGQIERSIGWSAPPRPSSA